MVFPSLQGSKDEKDFSQGDALLNALLTALGSVEYPFDLSHINPVKAEVYNQLLTLNVEVADIYAADDKLFVELIPAVQIESLNKYPYPSDNRQFKMILVPAYRYPVCGSPYLTKSC